MKYVIHIHRTYYAYAGRGCIAKYNNMTRTARNVILVALIANARNAANRRPQTCGEIVLGDLCVEDVSPRAESNSGKLERFFL